MPFIINQETDELDYYESAIGTPGSSTDNAIARWNGVGADAIQDSGVTIDDNNNIIMPDGKYIGQAAGHQIEFDDTNNRLGIDEPNPQTSVHFGCGLSDPGGTHKRYLFTCWETQQEGAKPTGLGAFDNFTIWGSHGSSSTPIFQVYNKHSTRVFKVGGDGKIVVTGLTVSKSSLCEAIIESNLGDAFLTLRRGNVGKKGHIQYKDWDGTLRWVVGVADSGDVAGCAGTEFMIGPDKNTPTFGWKERILESVLHPLGQLWLRALL